MTTSLDELLGPLAVLVAAQVLVTVFVLRRERARQEAERQRARLARHFAPAAVEALAQRPRLSGEHEVTALFADLRDFTALRERLGAEAAAALLDAWLQRAVAQVFAHGGAVEKLLGDGVLAWFGPPHGGADHAAQAVRCALALQVALAALNDALAAKDQRPLALGVGVHTGRALLTELGGPARRELTLLGEAVDVAARLEAATGAAGARVLTSAATRQAAGAAFKWTELGSLQGSGSSEPVRTWAPALPDAGETLTL